MGMERVMELLRDCFWKIDLARFKLSKIELDYLSIFFDITFDKIIDEFTMQEKSYLILKKKPKFISNSYIN